MRTFDYRHLPQQLFGGAVGDANVRLYEDRGKLELFKQLHASELDAMRDQAHFDNVDAQPSSATREVKWTLNYPNNNSTNIRLIEREQGYRFDVNYNYPVNDCLAIMTLIDDDSLIATKQEECEQLLTALFNLKTDE